MDKKYWTAVGFMTLGFGMAAFFGQTIGNKIDGIGDWTLPGYTVGVIFAAVGATGQGILRLQRSVESLSARLSEMEKKG